MFCNYCVFKNTVCITSLIYIYNKYHQHILISSLRKVNYYLLNVNDFFRNGIYLLFQFHTNCFGSICNLLTRTNFACYQKVSNTQFLELSPSVDGFIKFHSIRNSSCYSLLRVCHGAWGWLLWGCEGRSKNSCLRVCLRRVKAKEPWEPFSHSSSGSEAYPFPQKLPSTVTGFPKCAIPPRTTPSTDIVNAVNTKCHDWAHSSECQKRK